MANRDSVIERNLAWERMELVIGASGMTIPEFSQHIGLPRSGDAILQIKEQECGISFAMAERICRRYPQYNMVWLATGYGRIYVDTSRYRTIPYYDCNLDDMLNPEKFLPKEQLQMFFMEECDFAIRYRHYDMGDIIHAGSVLFVSEVKPESVLHGSLNIVIIGTHALARMVYRQMNNLLMLATHRDIDKQYVNLMEVRKMYTVKAMLNFNL